MAAQVLHMGWYCKVNRITIIYYTILADGLEKVIHLEK